MAAATMTPTNPHDCLANMDYIRQDSKMNRRYMAAGTEINTGVYETKQVLVHDGRAEQGNFKLDTAGFELIKHESKVSDWTSMTELETTYTDEIRDLVSNLTGASDIVVFGPVRRNTGGKKANNEDGSWNDQPPASDVHVDYTPLFAECLAREFAEKNGLDISQYKRWKFINLWRAISPGPQNYPLAFCRGDTVDDTEGLVNNLCYVDKIPDMDNLPEELPFDPMHREGSLFPYRPEHYWVYFSNMNKDEVMLFQLCDSEKVRPWRVPHCAFRNDIEGAIPRESVEIRTVCFFK